MEKSTWWDDGRELAPGVVAIAKPLRETVSIKFANYETSFLASQNAWKQPIPHEFTPKFDLAVCVKTAAVIQCDDETRIPFLKFRHAKHIFDEILQDCTRKEYSSQSNSQHLSSF